MNDNAVYMWFIKQNKNMKGIGFECNTKKSSMLCRKSFVIWAEFQPNSLAQPNVRLVTNVQVLKSKRYKLLHANAFFS